jgi:calcium/calmodulin-dependent protein kinase (CaM kinase) II
MEISEAWNYWNEGDPEPSGIINDYEIGRRIYSGPFSLVFRATAIRGAHMGKQLALKFLKHRKGMAESSKIDFELELLRLLRHPNIVPMLGNFRYKMFHCIIFPYAECGTLDDYAFRQRSKFRMSMEQANVVLRQLLEGLSHIHAMGFVHCDVKPANVLVHEVDQKGRPKLWLCDFGLAKRHEEAAKYTGILGTDCFQAPELFVKKGFSEKVDLWALGVVFYRVLTGAAPFVSRGDINPRRMAAIFRPPGWTVRVEGVKELVGRLLEFDPGKRITAHQALKDPWVGSLSDETEAEMEEREKEVIEEATNAPEIATRAN